MELKVGMYVRTKHNGIKQINALYSQAIFTDTFIRIENEQIIKASHNIIDLIEEGDYVNGYKITEIQEVNEYYPKRLLFVSFPDKSILDVFNNDNIKSIVTKEQFESMSYKVGE